MRWAARTRQWKSAKVARRAHNSLRCPTTDRTAVSSIPASHSRGKSNERKGNEKRKTKWKSCGGNRGLERNRRWYRKTSCHGGRGCGGQLCIFQGRCRQGR